MKRGSGSVAVHFRLVLKFTRGIHFALNCKILLHAYINAKYLTRLTENCSRNLIWGSAETLLLRSDGSAGWGRSRPAETLTILRWLLNLYKVNKRWTRLLKPAKCFRMCVKPVCSASAAWSCAMLDWLCGSLGEVWDGLSRGKPSYSPVTDYRHGETWFTIIKRAQALF